MDTFQESSPESSWATILDLLRADRQLSMHGESNGDILQLFAAVAPKTT
jgi:hypothetical protein